MRAGLVPMALALLACEGAEERRVRERAETERAMAEGVSLASGAAAEPRTGLWSEAQLFDRLLRAGVAPRRSDTGVRGPAWMGRDPVVILAGGGEVRAWIFADSIERRQVTDALDPETGTPPGSTVPFPPPMVFVMQNNLAAVVIGGTATNQERIVLALQAGLPAATAGPP